jgi:hypothetical protein
VPNTEHSGELTPSQKQHEKGYESNATNVVNVINMINSSSESESDDGDYFDAQFLVDHLPSDLKQLPEKEDYDSEEEFQEAMDEYLDYVHRLELARYVNNSMLSILIR